jgi:hypothetical protein
VIVYLVYLHLNDEMMIHDDHDVYVIQIDDVPVDLLGMMDIHIFDYQQILFDWLQVFLNDVFDHVLYLLLDYIIEGYQDLLIVKPLVRQG